jgi:hypothetical protein
LACVQASAQGARPDAHESTDGVTECWILIVTLNSRSNGIFPGANRGIGRHPPPINLANITPIADQLTPRSIDITRQPSHEQRRPKPIMEADVAYCASNSPQHRGPQDFRKTFVILVGVHPVAGSPSCGADEHLLEDERLSKTIEAALGVPVLLASLLASGRWQHPGDDVLRRALPWFESPLVFLRTTGAMESASASLDADADDDWASRYFHVTRGTEHRLGLPWLDARTAICIAVNRIPGDDVAIALDYRGENGSPMVVASGRSSERSGPRPVSVGQFRSRSAPNGARSRSTPETL